MKRKSGVTKQARLFNLHGIVRERQSYILYATLWGDCDVKRNELDKQLKASLEALMSKLSLTENEYPGNKEKDLFEMVEEARREWQAAIDYFNHVVDPDLVDHAIHAMDAAERKYTFLLKKARQENYRLPARIDLLRVRGDG